MEYILNTLTENLKEVDVIEDYFYFQNEYRRYIKEILNVKNKFEMLFEMYLLKDKDYPINYEEYISKKNEYINRINFKYNDYIEYEKDVLGYHNVRIKTDMNNSKYIKTLEILNVGKNITDIDRNAYLDSYIDFSYFFHNTKRVLGEIELLKFILADSYNFIAKLKFRAYDIMNNKYEISEKKNIEYLIKRDKEFTISNTIDDYEFIEYRLNVNTNNNYSNIQVEQIKKNIYRESSIELPHHFRVGSYNLKYNEAKNDYIYVSDLIADLIKKHDIYNHKDNEQKRNQLQLVFNGILLSFTFITVIIEIVKLYSNF